MIRNTKKALRCLDYSGLGDGNTCSDLDGIIEIKNTYLILIEFKEEGNELPTGQRLLLERLCDSWIQSNSKKKSVVLFATHRPDLFGAIPMRECEVQKIYKDGKWIKYTNNLLDTIHSIGKAWKITKLIKQ